MKRRAFVAGAGLLIGAGRASPAPAADDEAAVRQVIRDSYSVFYTERNTPKYRSLLTADYLLLEKGEILDVNGESALMPAPGAGYQRSDTFDFRKIRFHGDLAYVIYIVTSTVRNKQKPSQDGVWRFLESAIVRRSGTRWQIELLHSTQIPQPRA
jgi:hypothetical protein